jgi:RimJ/RimL family protein N-acetyltransferase
LWLLPLCPAKPPTPFSGAGMEALFIRRLGPGDASAFQTLRLHGLLSEPAAFSSSYEEEKDIGLATVEARLTMARDRATFGAFDGERLIGIVGLAREQKRKLQHKALIWGVYVIEQERRRGTGKMLLATALNFAQTLPGLLQVNLTVNADNAPASGLYHSLGFKEFGRETNALIIDGQPHDEIHMCMRI